MPEEPSCRLNGGRSIVRRIAWCRRRSIKTETVSGATAAAGIDRRGRTRKHWIRLHPLERKRNSVAGAIPFSRLPKQSATHGDDRARNFQVSFSFWFFFKGTGRFFLRFVSLKGVFLGPTLSAERVSLRLLVHKHIEVRLFTSRVLL